MSSEALKLSEIVRMINNVYETIRTKIVDLWWLDQGETPIVKPLSVEIQNGKVKYRDLPKTSIKFAFSELKKSVEALSQLKGEERLDLMEQIMLHYFKLRNVVSNIVDANKFVKMAEATIFEYKTKLGETSGEFKKINKEIYNLINSLKELFMDDPLKWVNKREKYMKKLEEIKQNLGKISVKMIAPKKEKISKHEEKDVLSVKSTEIKSSEESEISLEEG
ncbi:MAG: hypothetical protein ACP6IP_02380 [Candidatus Njordarchaeia archaeon]